MADPRATFEKNMKAMGADFSGPDRTYVLAANGTNEISWMCRHCGQALENFQNADGAVSLIHQRAWVDYDHDPDPVEIPPGAELDQLCDFCGVNEQLHWHLRGDRLVRHTGKVIHDHGGTWAACQACGELLSRNDLEGLLDRTAGRDRDLNPEQLRVFRLSALTDWLQYLATVTEMVYVGPRPGPAKMVPQMMPKLQAGLVKFWQNENLAEGLCRSGKPWTTPLPSFVCGEAGLPLANDFSRVFPPGESVPEAAWNAHVKHQIAGIWAADLFWVSSQFTSLAIMAGKDFEVPILSREDLPSQTGFLVWQDSVGEIPRHDENYPGNAAIRAVHWVVVPGGIWVAFYVQVEDADPQADVTVMRQKLGWLLSPNTGAGIPFGDVDVTDSEFATIRTFLATLFLLNQPGVAEVSHADYSKSEARKYQRNYGQPQPPIRLINLRKQPTRSGTGSTGPRGPINYRVYRKGHWKQQPYGPKRGLRRQIYVTGYIAGPDGAPLRASRPEVKVLK